MRTQQLAARDSLKRRGTWWTAGWFLAVGAVASAQASVIILTGGDPGEGYTPGPQAFYAYHFTVPTGSQATNTVQGVSFLPYNLFPAQPAGFSLINAAAYPGAAAAIGLSANDLALQGVGNILAYGAAHSTPPMTLTMGGLVSGKPYQLDLFWATGYSAPATYTITGAGSPIVENVPGVAGKYYDVRDNVVANGSGQIIVSVTNLNTDPDTPYISGFSITDVPEPSTVMLLGIGGLLFGKAIRHRAARTVMSQPASHSR